VKLIRALVFLAISAVLVFGPLGAHSGQLAIAQEGTTERPCGQPEGVGRPVDLENSTASTDPRLVYHGYNEFSGLSVEWAGMDWDDANDTILAVPLALPLTGAVTIKNGVGATVRAASGNLVLMVCGGSGEIDMVPEDGNTITLADGESFAMAPGDLVMIFLEETAPATYWVFGAGIAEGAPESIADIQVLAENGTAQVCGYTLCWDAPQLPPRPEMSECDFVTCAAVQPGGCGGLRCWVP
jgi:hypothetical protein